MQVISRHAGWARGFWHHIDDGTISIKGPDTCVRAVIREGRIVEQVQRKGTECTIVKYGQGMTVKRAGKIVKQVFYRPGSVQAVRRGGLWKKETGLKFCGAEGTLKCYSTHGGVYSKEVFTYDNGVRAYVAERDAARLEIRRPNGKLWIVLEGRVRPGFYPVVQRLGSVTSDLGLLWFMDQQEITVAVYNHSGTRVITGGKMENRQRQGRWLESGKVVYYLSGFKVSRELCEEDPEKWDGYEVLRIPNAQVRASFLKKMGYDRLLQKVKHEVIDTTADGGQLLAITLTRTRYTPPGIDSAMRLLKVICPSTGATYVLRVPPDVESCEQARHWTFGLDLESVRQGARLQLLRET